MIRGTSSLVLCFGLLCLVVLLKLPQQAEKLEFPTLLSLSGGRELTLEPTVINEVTLRRSNYGNGECSKLPASLESWPNTIFVGSLSGSRKPLISKFSVVTAFHGIPCGKVAPGHTEGGVVFHTSFVPHELHRLTEVVDNLLVGALSADPEEIRGLYITIDVPDKRVGCAVQWARESQKILGNITRAALARLPKRKAWPAHAPVVVEVIVPDSTLSSATMHTVFGIALDRTLGNPTVDRRTYFYMWKNSLMYAWIFVRWSPNALLPSGQTKADKCHLSARYMFHMDSDYRLSLEDPRALTRAARALEENKDVLAFSFFPKPTAPSEALNRSACFDPMTFVEDRSKHCSPYSFGAGGCAIEQVRINMTDTVGSRQKESWCSDAYIMWSTTVFIVDYQRLVPAFPFLATKSGDADKTVTNTAIEALLLDSLYQKTDQHRTPIGGSRLNVLTPREGIPLFTKRLDWGFSAFIDPASPFNTSGRDARRQGLSYIGRLPKIKDMPDELLNHVSNQGTHRDRVVQVRGKGGLRSWIKADKEAKAQKKRPSRGPRNP